MRTTDESKVERTAFGRYDEEIHPEVRGVEWLEYERISTPLSSGIITYGYRRIWPDGRYK